MENNITSKGKMLAEIWKIILLEMGKRWLKYGKYITRKGKMLVEIRKIILSVKGKCWLKCEK